MEDKEIVQLYWERSERAIDETDRKYGSYCKSIAYNILQNTGDAEESVNDAYLDAWNTMPPHRPSVLATFLGKITRRRSIDRWRAEHRIKRGGGEVLMALEELGECIAAEQNVEQEVEQRELVRQINRFLDALPATERRVFLCRYWYLDPIQEIALRFGFSQSKTTSMLHRLRRRLRRQLEEDFYETGTIA